MPAFLSSIDACNVSIKADLDELGVSIAEAAASLGVTRQQLYRVTKGENAISPDMALRLESGIGSGFLAAASDELRSGAGKNEGGGRRRQETRTEGRVIRTAATMPTTASGTNPRNSQVDATLAASRLRPPEKPLALATRPQIAAPTA